MTAPTGFSRREFLNLTGTAAAGAFILGFQFGCADPGAEDGAGGGAELPSMDGDAWEPNAFVHVYPTGAITLVVHRSEMGQGIRTACAMLLAEELEVGLDQIRIEQAEGHPRFGNQNTDGSRSVRTHFVSLRRAGAAARETLIAAAAQDWGVSADECEASRGRVTHAASGNDAGYGELIATAATLEPPTNPELKSPEDFDIVGRPTAGLDISDIVTGQAVYGGDVVIDGMAYASIERAPTLDGTPTSWDREAALAVPGVLDVIEMPADPARLYNHGLAVLAEHTGPGAALPVVAR